MRNNKVIIIVNINLFFCKKNNNESLNMDIMIYLLENKYKDSNYISMYFENIKMMANLFDA